ncbi:hypothetical protein CAEBREN_01243 [Caenorhabditis brenneri]|uniref:Uncharacterized protein n=1 Tax=Caenorhabditis brenneri TaxID=135651 RepID=G0MHT6_CAEBE|nr:hypothetical protein CAEBREN_01243 [Caenorhabditis brenneri]
MQLLDASKIPIRECTCHLAGPQAWMCLIDYLLPGVSDNLNIRRELLRVVRNEKEADEFNTDTLFWKSLEYNLVESAEKHFWELYEYMTDRSPRMYVNSPLNLLPKFMSVMMRAFNWDIVADDYYFVHLTKKNTFIKHGVGEVFVRFAVGAKNSRQMFQHLNPFLDMMIAVDVNTVFQKIEGIADISDWDEPWERVTETRNVRLPPPPGSSDESTSGGIPGNEVKSEIDFYFYVEETPRLTTKKVVYERPKTSIPLTDPMTQLSPTERIMYQKNILTKEDFSPGEHEPAYFIITTFSSPFDRYRRAVKRSPPPPAPRWLYEQDFAAT